jgi:hypothetical protein
MVITPEALTLAKVSVACAKTPLAAKMARVRAAIFSFIRSPLVNEKN